MTTLLNTVDARAPNLAPQAVRVVGAQFKEDDIGAAGTYIADIFVPAYALIWDFVIHSEELFAAGTSAGLVIGTYTVDADGNISTAEDDNGLLETTSLKATNLTKGQAITPWGDGASTLGRLGGIGSASTTEGSSTHGLDLMADHDRFVRAIVTTVGTVGTAGEAYFYLMYALPEMDIATAALS